jgi:probable phosphoglycerate mutase
MEVEIGAWTGMKFEPLANDPLWRFYNAFRSGTRPPGGELMVEVQQRMVTGIERLRTENPHGTLAVISHADPIKTVLAHYAGIPLDFFLRLEISLVSVSILKIGDYGPKVLCVNCPGEIPEFLVSL